jgi:lysophospholipase L1-like esterase
VLWRIDHGELDTVAPKVVVLMIGTNNLGSDTPAEIAEGITAVVKRIRDKLPHTKVLLLGIFPRAKTSNNPNRIRLEAVNSRIARLGDGENVHYLDIARHFLNEDGSLSPEIMPDYLHLSRKGYRIWADAIEPKLWELSQSNGS